MSTRPLLLDLFCGAGGAAMGYYRAGFDVVGVDLKPQPEYPFPFIQADVLAFPIALSGFDAVHASPPCQAYTSMRRFGKGAGDGAPDLVAPVRERLLDAGLPFVIENVPGSPLLRPVVLCGTSFGLGVRRHRLFEATFAIPQLPHAHKGHRPIAVYGDHPQTPGERGTYRVNRARTLQEGQEAMGIDWMGWRTLTQAIPPAYTEHIGRALLS